MKTAILGLAALILLSCGQQAAPPEDQTAAAESQPGGVSLDLILFSPGLDNAFFFQVFYEVTNAPHILPTAVCVFLTLLDQIRNRLSVVFEVFKA